MKRIMMNIAALLLALWYCLSIIGFDVHTCMRSGDAFVVTSFSVIDCEDLHPGHHEDCGHHDADGHHHHGVSDDCTCRTAGETHIHDRQCCTDDFHVIHLTGVRIDDGKDQKCDCSGHCFCPEIMRPMTSLAHSSFSSKKIPLLPDKGVIMPDYQAFLKIWRI